MNEATLRQIEEQIDLQVGGQIGKIKQKLFRSLFKREYQQLEMQVNRISDQIWQKTKIDTIYHAKNFGYLVFELNDKLYLTYNNGYLANSDDWSKEVAEYIAMKEGVLMTDAHWEVVNFLREYYDEYKIAPMNKILIKAIAKKFGPEKGNNRYLYKLFPEGPTRQANKIAGLPKPMGD